MTEVTTERFADLVRAHHAAVYRAALRVTENVDDAADAAQQAFVVALEQGERLLGAEHPERVLKWLAVKQALMILRGERRRRTREHAIAMTQDAEQKEPLDTADRHEQQRLARAALRELPGEVRLALELRFGEDMTFKEVAQAQDVSEPTAHERVQRGLETLRARLRTSAGAILAVDLETLVRASTRLPPASVPAGLEGKLLALSAKTAGSTLALLPLLVTGGVLLTALFVAPYFLRDEPKQDAGAAPTTASAPANPPASGANGDPTREPVVAQDAQEPARETTTPGALVPPPDVAPAALVAPKATLHGRVVHADGRSLDTMTVTAASVVRDGKMTREVATAIVREDGAFDLDVSVLGDPDEDFEVWVWYEENAPVVAPLSIRLKPHEERTLDPFVVSLDIPSRKGDWTIDATLVAPDGEIPVGTPVTVWRCIPTASSEEYDVTSRQCYAKTTEGGHVQLTGSWLGKTRIDLEVFSATTFDRYSLEFVQESSGSTQRTFVLPEPTRWLDMQPDDGVSGFQPPPAKGTGTIAARVRDPDGKPLLRSFHDVDAWQVGTLDAEAIAFDVIPNRLFRDSCQVCFGGSPPETDLANLTGLKPGRYVVIGYDSYTRNNSAPGISIPVDVEADRAADVTVTMNARALLAGTVRDVDGEPITDAIVVVTGRGPITDERVAKLDATVRSTAGEGTFSFHFTRSDADGHFAFGAMSPGVTARVVALHPEREPAFSAFATLEPRGEIRDLDVRFARKRER